MAVVVVSLPVVVVISITVVVFNIVVLLYPAAIELVFEKVYKLATLIVLVTFSVTVMILVTETGEHTAAVMVGRSVVVELVIFANAEEVLLKDVEVLLISNVEVLFIETETPSTAPT